MTVMWVKKLDNRRIVALGHMALESLVFDFAQSPFVSTSKNLLYCKDAVTEGCIRGVGVCPPTRNICLSDV